MTVEDCLKLSISPGEGVIGYRMLGSSAGGKDILDRLAINHLQSARVYALRGSLASRIYRLLSLGTA